MARRTKIYEGKAKILYEGPEQDTVIQYFKDDATAFNNQKRDVIAGKGVLNNRISAHIMTRLEQVGIPTHFLRAINMREQLVRKVEIVPVEVIIRNVAAGSMAKRLGLKEGQELPRPIVEFCYKSDAAGDPVVSEDMVAAMGWAHPYEMEDMMALTTRINDFLSGLFMGIGLRLVDMKLEFGRYWYEDELYIILGDEISPDTCRLWDVQTNERLDKDRFRHDLGDLIEGYQDVAYRLGLLPNKDAFKSGSIDEQLAASLEAIESESVPGKGLSATPIKSVKPKPRKF